MNQDKIEQLAIKACEQAAKSIRGHSSAINFVNHLLTDTEKIKIGRRILIAQAILQGKTRYEINNALHVSPNMHSQILKWVGSEFPEYQRYPSKTKAVRSKKVSEPVPQFSYTDLKRRYPMHFLLFNMTESLFRK